VKNCKTTEDRLRPARRRYGCDLWFNASDLDRGPEEFRDLPEKFRLKALERR